MKYNTSKYYIISYFCFRERKLVLLCTIVESIRTFVGTFRNCIMRVKDFEISLTL